MYGGMIAFFWAICYRLFLAVSKEPNRNIKYILRTSAFAFVLFFCDVVWRIIFDRWRILHPNTPDSYLFMLEHWHAMLSVPLFGVTMRTIVQVKIVSRLELIACEVPIVALGIIYAVTAHMWAFYASLGFVVAYSVIMFGYVHISARRYQERLNNTFANTYTRGVRWVLVTVNLLMLSFLLWLVIMVVIPGDTAEIIYFLMCMVPFVFYSRRLTRHNFKNITLLDVEEAKEKEDIESAFECLDEDGPHKVWQSAEFGDAIMKYCADPDNFTNTELSIVDVASAVGSNRTYVSLWCKEQGENFSSLISRIRLAYAEKLLANTNRSIGEIVTMSGFSSSRAFRNVFVERHGCTPSEFRARLNEQ